MSIYTDVVYTFILWSSCAPDITKSISLSLRLSPPLPIPLSLSLSLSLSPSPSLPIPLPLSFSLPIPLPLSFSLPHLLPPAGTRELDRYGLSTVVKQDISDVDWHRKFESLFRAILDYRLKEDAFSRVREYIVHVLPQTPSPTYACTCTCT